MMRSDVNKGIEYWERTGYGIDPNQIVFRHYETDCECIRCRPGLHPIVETFQNGRIETYPSYTLAAQYREH